MIIIGYPGIGKSSLAGAYNKYIDLESSNFNKPDLKKPEGWHKTYCKVAEDLSRQGYIVFVSCHKEVQDYLYSSDEIVALCYPTIELKDLWIGKLLYRYEHDICDKNLAAFETAVNNYTKHITALNDSPYEHKIILSSIDYILDNEIKDFIHKEIDTPV